jgi:transposase
MKMEDLFKIALGLQDPWLVERAELLDQQGTRQLHLQIGHKPGAKFFYEGEQYAVYDHQERTWRHLNFFEHECYLHARVPRVRTRSGQVLLVDVPWASPGSSFTLLFEAYAALLVEGGMPCTKAGDYMGISGKSIWTIIRRMVSTALSEQPLEDVNQLGIDETSSKKGHHYLTVLTDMDRRKVVGVGQGKDQNALKDALVDMEIRGARSDNVELITMDMSTSYIAGVSRWMPDAEIVFDRFHLEQGMNKVVDEVRKEEAKKYIELKMTKYLWLKNEARLSQAQHSKLSVLENSYPTLGAAYRLKEQFKEVLNDAYFTSKLKGINQWMKMAWKSGIDQVQRFVNMLAEHWYGIKTYFEYCVTNGFAERVNLKIQEIKRIARGYRNPHNFILMIYFHLGKLDLNLPTKYG